MNTKEIQVAYPHFSADIAKCKQYQDCKPDPFKRYVIHNDDRNLFLIGNRLYVKINEHEKRYAGSFVDNPYDFAQDFTVEPWVWMENNALQIVREYALMANRDALSRHIAAIEKDKEDINAALEKLKGIQV